MNKELWIVGRIVGPGPNGWEFVGVFDEEQAAIEACPTPSHFLGPATLNERLPDETQPWPGSYYPVPLDDEVDIDV